MANSKAPTHTTITLYGVKLLGLILAGFFLLKTPFMEPALDMFCLMLAKVTAGILSVFDPEIHREGINYYRNNWGNAIAVTYECGAFEFSLIGGCAIMLMEFSLRRRLGYLLICLALIQSANVLRLIVLLYGRVLLSPDAFNSLHYQLIPFFFGAFCLALLFVLTQCPEESGTAGP